MVSLPEGIRNGANGAVVGALTGIALVESLRYLAKFPPAGPNSDGYSPVYTFLEQYGLEFLATNENWYFTLVGFSMIVGGLIGALSRPGR